MINIVLASDNNFVQHCAVTMVSVLKNNVDVHFYLFTEGLTDDNQNSLKGLVEQNGGILHICTIESNAVKDFPMPKSGGLHISVATYYRLFVERILPSSINKVIYLDCDIVNRGSLSELLEINMDKYAVGAVYQPMNESSLNDQKRLGIPAAVGYFNAGVLLLNLDYWRRNNVTKRLFEFIANHFDIIKQHDQDALNAVLYDAVYPISYTWNCLSLFLLREKKVFPERVNYNNRIENPFIIHYVSVPKPWEYGCNNPFKKDYYYYLNLTPFKGSKPRFVFSKYFKNVIIQKIFLLIGILDIFKLRKLLKRRDR